MSEAYELIKKYRSTIFEGGNFDLIAKVEVMDPNIAAPRRIMHTGVLDLNFNKIAQTPKKSTINGTKKFVIKTTSEENKENCGGKHCITKENYKEKNAGKLIQEISIRLAGFGGNVPTEEFDNRTEATIKQFQRDYMKVPETGKICGGLLKAIDEFCETWIETVSAYKCLCHASDSPVKASDRCPEFGKGGANENPGMHRSLLWGISALKFYLSKQTEYKYNYISAGYRCNAHNQAKGRTSTNHMGMAIDSHFYYNNGKTAINKENISKLKAIRDDYFIKYLKSKEGWSIPANNFRTEPIGTEKDESYSWIHLDVKLYDSKYKSSDFFTKTQLNLKGKLLVELAKECGFIDMCNCNGNG